MPASGSVYEKRKSLSEGGLTALQAAQSMATLVLLTFFLRPMQMPVQHLQNSMGGQLLRELQSIVV
jgi:hypothetical protein